MARQYILALMVTPTAERRRDASPKAVCVVDELWAGQRVAPCCIDVMCASSQGNSYAQLRVRCSLFAVVHGAFSQHVARIAEQARTFPPFSTLDSPANYMSCMNTHYNTSRASTATHLITGSLASLVQVAPRLEENTRCVLVRKQTLVETQCVNASLVSTSLFTFVR